MRHYVKGTSEQRWHAKYEVQVNGCWLWIAALNDKGYGVFKPLEEPTVYAHRYGYRLLVGPIPEGLELDHLCHTPRCVNPEHLEPVTHLVNMRRSANALRPNCTNGHPRDGVLTSGQRYCKTCHREREAARKQRIRGAR